MKKYILLSILCMMLYVSALDITIYSEQNTQSYWGFSSYYSDDSLALIRDDRTIDLNSGSNTFSFTDVSSQIDPTSIQLIDNTCGLTVLEQNYKYDLVSSSKLLERYIGKQLTLVLSNSNGDEEIAGKLLSYSPDIVLETTAGIVVVNSGSVKYTYYPSLPEGLITKPTLEWSVDSVCGGSHDLEVQYLTKGISWKADYVATTNADETAVDIQAWVTIDNQAGTTFEDANLKLMAGDLHLVSDYDYYGYYDYYYEETASAAYQGFEEESLFEYHMYTLDRSVTINDNEVKQMTLFTAEDVPVTKEYVFDGDRNDEVRVMLEFENSKESNLGVPMPAGKVRAYVPDSDGQLQFVGEDTIDHTPTDEIIRLYVGDAFDIVAERTRVDYEEYGSCAAKEGYEVVIRNHKDEGIEVKVLDSIWYWTDWDMQFSNYDYELESASDVVWTIPVEAGGEETLQYTIYYEWC